MNNEDTVLCTKKDDDILKMIISNSYKLLTPKLIKEYESTNDNVKFPLVNSTTIEALSKSLAGLLSYKVSPEIHQRYLVRINLIENLRQWSQITGDVCTQELSLQDSEKEYEFWLKTLEKYLTKKIINGCDDVDDLVQLAEILLHANDENILNNKQYVVQVVDRILSLSDQSDKSKNFLQYLVEKRNSCLDSDLIEKIYLTQKVLLIEKPLDNCFSEFYLDETKIENLNKIDYLFEKVTDSPSLFGAISNHLKNLFICSKYDQKTINYIKKVMEKIQFYCDKHNKDIVDLYPIKLQYCVLLLRIKPCYHNEKSKNYTIKSLKEIFMNDHNDTLILMSHFSEWMNEYLKFFEILDES